MDILTLIIVGIITIYIIIEFITSKNKTMFGLIFVLILITASLPFHYIPSKFMAFPKNTLTFSNTIITEEDIDNIIERYNNSNIFEQTALNNEPLIRKLREVGVLIDNGEK